MQYWAALDIVNQVAGEVGQSRVTTMFAPEDTNEVQSIQMLAALQAAGNELLLFYPFEQFARTLTFSFVVGQGSYALPADWAYFIDQTQWDRTNMSPLMGPKSAAEWAWLKGAAPAPSGTRYRVMANKLEFLPVPASVASVSMEYISGNWVQSAAAVGGVPDKAMVRADGDIVWYHPWMMIKYTKLKWLQLKGFDQTAAAADFQRIYEAMRGKDVGAEVLSLVPSSSPQWIGWGNVPEGNWGV
jgi:hypothetical protein